MSLRSMEHQAQGRFSRKHSLLSVGVAVFVTGIVAAKAGDQGRGSAVVAQEATKLRDLAFSLTRLVDARATT